MIKLPTPGFLLSAFFQVCRRFPGTILIAILGTLACIGLMDAAGVDNERFFVRIWITGQLGVPLLTAMVAFSESKNWNDLRSWLLQGAGLLILVACWFWLDDKAVDFEWKILPQYMALLLVFHLMVAVAPFLNRSSIRDFWEYNRQLFANFIVGASFSFILFAGLSAAILAVDNLFDLNIPDRIYGKLFVVIAGIFNTSYFLFQFPDSYNTEDADGGAYNWVFRNLCKYILIPIVILYFIILYAYGAKVGLQWSLPHGWISSLVLGFSVAGIFTYLLNFYLAEEDDSPLVKGFKRWFWWVVLPLTGLLFIAIGRRISDYGVTEERYLVAHLGVWLMAACLYFLFSKNDNIKFIPISLALFALVWAFGPLNAFSVSERSQKGIIKEILTQNGRFENGKLKPGTQPLTDPERAQVGSAIQYLSYHNALTELLPSPIDSSWLAYDGLMNWLKLEVIATDATKHLSISSEDKTGPLEIRGFDLAYNVNLNSETEPETQQSGNFFKLSKDGKMLEWHKIKDGKDTLVEMFSLIPMIQKWEGKMSLTEAYTYTSLPLGERLFNYTGRKGVIRCIAEEAEISVEGAEKKVYSYAGWVFLKEK